MTYIVSHNVLSIDNRRSATGESETGENVECGRFAGSVRSEQTETLVVPNSDTQSIDRSKLSENTDQILHDHSAIFGFLLMNNLFFEVNCLTRSEFLQTFFITALIQVHLTTGFLGIGFSVLCLILKIAIRILLCCMKTIITIEINAARNRKKMSRAERKSSARDDFLFTDKVLSSPTDS